MCLWPSCENRADPSSWQTGIKRAYLRTWAESKNRTYLAMISNKPQKLSLDGIKVEIYETLSSTQTLLLQRAQPSLCLVARHQSHGIGSRGNTWESVKVGIYFSLALNKEELPSDLALQSASIYFGFCFKEVINELGVEVWLKWPNDIYIGEKKAGGCHERMRGAWFKGSEALGLFRRYGAGGS